jgi:hypothetical protein
VRRWTPTGSRPWAGLLAERHRQAVEPEPDRSLLNYAESSRIGDWSMRSALVRFAQPEPERAAALLELVRRLDTVLGHVTRLREKRAALCDRALDLGEDWGGEPPLADPTDPYPDTRTTDLARLARAAPDGFATVLTVHTEIIELDHETAHAA